MILQKLHPISLDGDIIIIIINKLINLSVLEKWSAQKRSIKKLPTCGHHCDQLLVSQADESFCALVTPQSSIQRSHFEQSAVDCLENAEVHTEMRLARFHTVDDRFDWMSVHSGGPRPDPDLIDIYQNSTSNK